MSTELALTEKEIEFLKLYAKGYTSPQIAKQWFASKNTTRTHMKNIRNKMNVPSINAAVSLAHQERIINIDELTILRKVTKK